MFMHNPARAVELKGLIDGIKSRLAALEAAAARGEGQPGSAPAHAGPTRGPASAAPTGPSQGAGTSHLAFPGGYAAAGGSGAGHMAGPGPGMPMQPMLGEGALLSRPPVEPWVPGPPSASQVVDVDTMMDGAIKYKGKSFSWTKVRGPCHGARRCIRSCAP